jgi:hypothetical protein
LLVCLAMALAGTGVGLAQPPAMAAALAAVPDADAGRASALINTLRQLAGVLGVAVVGAAVQAAYAGRLAGRLTALPRYAQGQIRSSVTNLDPALAGRPGSVAGPVRAEVAAAFTHATGAVLGCCAAVTILALALVALTRTRGKRARTRGTRDPREARPDPRDARPDPRDARPDRPRRARRLLTRNGAPR